jgi:EF-P beta-lysylation protein EpmB
MAIPIWRQVQRENFTDIQKLGRFLQLSEENRAQLWKTPRFVLNLPKRLAAKIEKNNLHDPILRQFIPLLDEQIETPGFLPDPVSDKTFQKEKKILHKYPGRALIVATSACAMNCRFCFRQNFPYEITPDIEATIAYFQNHPHLKEAIFSGGDPLSLPDATLATYLDAFNKIPHLKRIRFHTRFPIGIPERIDPSFLKTLSSSTKQIYFTLHCNHPKELDPDVVSSLRQIARLGIPLLNQAVLLKGVNDNKETQLALSEALVDAGILPYYLHLLDPVQGAAHFLVPDQTGIDLLKHVQEHLSGYGVPRLVREEPGKQSKTYL